MIPVLYSETERDYGHGGIGVLTDTMTYLVTEEANGEFELYLEYPVQGSMFTELKNNRLVKAKPNDLDDDHVFRIYEVVKDLERQTVYIYATSISNDLGNSMVSSLKITSKTAQEALNLLKANLIETTHFNFVSDIATRSSTEWDFRNPLNCIVGEDGSLVKYWGGEVKRTNDTVYLYARRGRDNVAVLREGKNLEGLEMTISTKGIVTKILPYMTRYDETTGEERLIVGNIVTSPLVNNYPVKSIKAVDYTLYDDVETEAELNTLAGGYFTYQNPGVDKPKVSIDIDIMQLADSPLYSQYSKLESLGLFDSVSVYIPRFDVSVIVKVNKIEYNGLLERAEKIQCGDPVGNIFDDVKAGYTNMIINTEAKITNIVQKAANGVSSIFRGTSEPTNGVKTGDLWYKPVGEFEIEMYQWNGMEWELILSTKELNMYRPLIEAAIEAAEQAKLEAEQAYLDSVAEAERLVTAQTEAFDVEMDARQTEIAGVKTTAENTQASIDQAVQNAGFTSLSQSLVDIKAIAEAAETDADQALLDLQSKASTAELNAYSAATDAELALKASTKALEDGLALKVATNTYNTKVTELNSLIAAAQSKADTAASDLLKKADTTFVNTELAKKLATSTYNTKMTALDTAISGHGTRLKATEDGLALTATKVEVDAVRTRMDEAETEISQNSDAIALKASQSSLDTTNGKLATAEASLVVQSGQIASKVSQTDFNALNGRVSTAETTITQQAGKIALKASQLDLDAATDDISDINASLTIQAGQIESKVSQTDFNALNGRVGTAESSITQQAGQIASKVSQTDFNALNGRVGTAESSISQQAGEIALRVTTTTYNSGIGSKENTITKATTAPTHLNGRLWLDTSATPNVLKRSTGSAWVKVTPTTPGEVGAYSAGDGSALAGRVSTAETSITANTTAIGLRATKTDLDATTGRVTTAEGTISVQAGQIALKANQTTVDTLTGRVGTAETNISANTTAINLRATKSSVDTLTGRVTTAEGTITAQAGQIALRATTATVNALTGRVSTAEASIVTQSGRIDLAATKTELTTAIDGIQVGGRNLLRNTNREHEASPREYMSLPYDLTPVFDEHGLDQEYTMSFDLKSKDISKNSSIQIYPSPGTVIPNRYLFPVVSFKVTTEYQRFSMTFKPTDGNKDKTTTYIAVYGQYDTGNFPMLRNIKIEKGNKATDWTPAPEDVDAAISTVQSNLTVEVGKITALTTRVSGSETNISNVTQTVSGINTTISTLRTDVDGKATIVSLNQVKSTADGNKTTISNHAGRLTTVETNVSGLQTTVADKADKSQITQLTTSISTKVESSTYNSKMTQLDNAINLRVVKADITEAILADKKIKDTRTTNQLPSWYFTTYPSQRIEEFKTGTVIGITGVATFVKLVTDVPWTGTSGGVVSQTAYSTYGIYSRSGNAAATAWGSWVKQTDSSNVLAQVNLSTEGVLIQGKRIQLDGDVTMTAAYVTKLNTQTLSAITANITSIRSQVLVTDSVTSTHIKAENALIDGIFGTTALITRLTSKTAFINNIKAINISADKVTTGTLNAANVSIINMNAANITTGRLNGLELYGGHINGGRITSTGTVGELAINSASLTVYNDKVVNGQIQRAVVALSNEAQDFPGLRIWHGIVNSAGTVISSFGSTNITPEDGISTGKPLRVGAVTITGGSNIQNSASNIMHITDAQDNAIDLGVKNLTASGQVSGAKVVAGHLTLDGGNNIVSNSNSTINFMRTDGQRTNIAANTIESPGMRMGTSSTLYLLNSDMMYIANANDDLRDLRVRMLSARDRVTGGNLSLFNNDIVHNGNADIHFTGANGTRMNIHAARVSSGNQVMSTGNTYYALNGNTLYFADRNDARIDIGVRTVSQSSEYRLKAGFEIIGEQEAIDEILKTDVVKYHFKGDDEPRLGLIIGGGYQTSGLFVAKDGRSKKDSDIIGALMLSVKYLYNTQNTSIEQVRRVYANEIWQLKGRVNSDILRIDTFVTQHELEIKNLKKRIKQLEEKTS